VPAGERDCLPRGCQLGGWQQRQQAPQLLKGGAQAPQQQRAQRSGGNGAHIRRQAHAAGSARL
jgi:hypothetical protein